nr:MAG TPA: helix-turn-helix domain protein [Caudoviricetes sp.]
MSAVYIEIEANALVALREKGLSVRQIAGVYGVSYTFVRNRLLAAGVNLERIKR